MGDVTEDDAFAPFLNPIRDLAQNFEINLGEILQKYLDRIDSENIQKAIDQVNFAEAAIVLQQSATIYGKKVDYLAQLVMQILDSYQRKKKQEEAAAAQKKGKAGVSELADESPDFCEIDEDELFGGNVQINISPDHVPIAIKLHPKYYPQLEMKVATEKKLPLLGLQNNVIGNKYDFRVNKYLSADGMLIDEPELKIMGSAPDTNYDLITRVDQQPVINDKLNVENNDLNVSDNVPGPSNIGCEDVCENFDNDPVPNFEASKEKIVEHAERRSTARRKPDKIVTLDVDPWKPWPADKNVPNKKFVRAITYKIPPELLNPPEKQKKQEVSSIFQFFKEKTARRVEKRMGLLADLEFADWEKNTDTPPSPTEVAAMWDQLDEMFGEDGVEGSLSDDARSDDGFINDEQEDLEEEDCFMEDIASEGCNVGVPLPVNEFPTTSLAEALGKHLHQEIPFADNSTYEEYSREAFSVAAHAAKSSAGLTAKVNEWHDSIRPQLQAASERGSFDIHAYGTRIIEKFQPNSSKFVSFKDITEFEKTEDVPRFFLASLMLANSGNVEIGKMDDTPLAMDCMCLSLLSSTRHHKVFEEAEGDDA